MITIIAAVSGGRSSAMMAWILQNSEKYKDYQKIYVFANTGQERPETIQFLKDMVKHWDIPLNLIEGVYSSEMGVGVKHKVVDFETLDMNSGPFKGAIMHLNKNKWTGVPNQAIPFCSDYLKKRPTDHFAKTVLNNGKWITSLGYRKEDIPKRITFKELDLTPNKIAPLITDFDRPFGISELDLFFDNQPFKLQISSDIGNCELCYKKSDRNLIKSLRAGCKSIDFYREMENQYGNKFFRGNKSIDDLIKLAAGPEQLQLFNSIGESCHCGL